MEERIVVVNKNFFINCYIFARVLAVVGAVSYVYGLIWFFGAVDDLIVRNSFIVIIVAITAAVIPRYYLVNEQKKKIIYRIILLISCVTGLIVEFQSIMYLSAITEFDIAIILSFIIMFVESFYPVANN